MFYSQREARYNYNTHHFEHFVLDFKSNHFSFLGEGPHQIIPKDDEPLFDNNTPAKRKQATTPGKGLQSKRTCNPRREIHFQNVMGDSSNDEDWNNMSHERSTSSSSCCKEQKLENEALRKRLAKVHRRLNIACKSLQFQWVDPNKLIFLLN